MMDGLLWFMVCGDTPYKPCNNDDLLGHRCAMPQPPLLLGVSGMPTQAWAWHPAQGTPAGQWVVGGNDC